MPRDTATFGLRNARSHAVAALSSGLGLRREIRESAGLASVRGAIVSFESTFVAAISAARTPEAAWQALGELADAVAGRQVFTVMMVDMAAGLVRRAYSSHPAVYPTSGTKPLGHNTGDWFETVIVGKRSFVANSIEDIAKVFPDHALIAGLGCGAVINYPVVLQGNLVAAVTLLDHTGHYTPERVRAVEEQLAVPARLCAALTLLGNKQQVAA